MICRYKENDEGLADNPWEQESDPKGFYFAFTREYNGMVLHDTSEAEDKVDMFKFKIRYDKLITRNICHLNLDQGFI